MKAKTFIIVSIVAILIYSCKKEQLNRWKHGDIVYYDNSPNSAPELTNSYRIDSIDFTHTDGTEDLYTYYTTSSNGIDVGMREDQFRKANKKQRDGYKWGDKPSISIDQFRIVLKTDTAYWLSHGLTISQFDRELYHHYK